MKKKLNLCVRLFLYNMELEDKDLGRIVLVKNNRAKRITVRYRNGMYSLTYPPFVKLSSIEEALGKMKPELLKLKAKSVDKLLFNTETLFKTYTFEVRITKSDLTNFYVGFKEGVLSISCPRQTVFEEEATQTFIRGKIERTLRTEAKRILPSIVEEEATKHGFVYTNVRISKSQSRWGSCSSQKNINLSYYCLLLPEHLLRLIVLHELCHTKEMNHSKDFWNLLDKVTGGKAKELTKELKQYRPYF